jgi:hypothetical protein
MLVLKAIQGVDAGDVGGRAGEARFRRGRAGTGLKVGYLPAWMKEARPPTSTAPRWNAAKLGLTPVPVALPDWPYQSLNAVLFAEAAAAFEDITLDGRVDQLKAQVPDAWPNLFREARFISAVDSCRPIACAARWRWRWRASWRQVDLLLVPSLRDEMLTISNFTGHPSLTLRTGSVQVAQARSRLGARSGQPAAEVFAAAHACRMA